MRMFIKSYKWKIQSYSWKKWIRTGNTKKDIDFRFI